MAGSQPPGMVSIVPDKVLDAAKLAVQLENKKEGTHYLLEYVACYWPKTQGDNYNMVIKVSDPDSQTSPVFAVKLYDGANKELKNFLRVFDQID